jgi:hypothetical protein
MIHHTNTFLVITTLHLVFLTVTTDVYNTDPFIRKQKEATTDRQHHSSGTDYQKMATRDKTESFTNVASTFHNELNVRLENLLSAFNISSYTGTCSDILNYTDINFLLTLYNKQKFYELITMIKRMSMKFDTLVKKSGRFVCTGNTNL